MKNTYIYLVIAGIIGFAAWRKQNPEKEPIPTSAGNTSAPAAPSPSIFPSTN